MQKNSNIYFIKRIMNWWVLLVIAFICNSFANVLLKIWAEDWIVLTKNIFKLINGNKFLIWWALLFAMNLIVYVLALKTIPISVAYPIMIGMSLTIITTIWFFFLHEHISYVHIIAYILVFLWIFLLVYAGK